MVAPCIVLFMDCLNLYNMINFMHQLGWTTCPESWSNRLLDVSVKLNRTFIYLFYNDFYFFHYSWFTVFFQFSAAQQGDHVYILFSHIILLHHKWPDIVPSAIQDPIAYPFQRLEFASFNPKFQFHPAPSPASSTTTNLFSMNMIFFSVESFVCALH